tara:strand:+ start:635 stop:769 length:135 start_codon:yes stop_codon:yes gene_type:complete
MIKSGKGFQVKNKNSKKTYSKNPTSKTKAKKQLNLLKNKYKKKK